MEARPLDTWHLATSRVASGTNLLAVPFDVESRQVVGKPVPMVDGDSRETFRFERLMPRRQAARWPTLRGRLHAGITRELVWVTRSGQEEPLGTPARASPYPRLSPDGTESGAGRA